MIPMRWQRSECLQFLRYFVNGAIATLTHYAVLTFLVGPMNMLPIGFASFLGAAVGTTASFFGNRKFVFKTVYSPIEQQVIRFAILYSGLALIHGLLMYVWCDWAGANYHLGFLIATILQFILSYLFNRKMVFLNDKRGAN